MLDYNYIIENTEECIKRLNNRNGNFDYLNKIENLVKARNKLIFTNDNLKAQRNIKSKEVGQLIKSKAKKSIIDNLKTEITKSKELVLANDEKIIELKSKIIEILMSTPNLPHKKCPIGKGENDNIEIKK